MEELSPREIIDELERKFGNSRDTARAIQVPFTRYLGWILDPWSMPAQVKRALAFRAGLRGNNTGYGFEDVAA